MIKPRNIKNYIQNVENLIVKPTVIDAAAHAKIDALMDIKNMIDYWWVQAFSINGDAFGTSSTYMYKKKNDKLYWGPLWDFDFAWGYARNEDRDLRGFAISSTVWHTALREKDPLYGQMLKDIFIPGRVFHIDISTYLVSSLFLVSFHNGHGNHIILPHDPIDIESLHFYH